MWCTSEYSAVVVSVVGTVILCTHSAVTAHQLVCMIRDGVLMNVRLQIPAAGGSSRSHYYTAVQ